MPRQFALYDQVLILRYLAKWAVLLTPVAVCIGTICAAFLWMLDWATDTRIEHGWLLFALPVGGIAIAWVYRTVGRSVEAGNNLIVDAIHAPGTGVPPRIVPLIFLATVGSHLLGASVGREGTAVQMGGGVAAAMTRFVRLSPADTRVLLMAGVAAGFGAVFGTPIAGAIFALEVLTIGRMDYGALIPVLYASLLADYTAAAWHAHHTEYTIAVVTASGGLPFDLWLMAKVIVASIAFGLAALLFSELAHGVNRLARRVIGNPLFRPAVGGLLTIGLVYLLGTRAYLGLGVTSVDIGDTSIVSSFQAGGADSFSWWWKIAFTAIAVGMGFKGGEVTPLFFIGAALGNRMAALLSAPADLFAGLGFVAIFAGAANTPLACTMMGIELFGADATPYLAVACFVAYLISGHSGIYLSQRIGTPKVHTITIEPGTSSSLRSVQQSRVLFPRRASRGATSPPNGASPAAGDDAAEPREPGPVP